jgi:hypothetical protein
MNLSPNGANAFALAVKHKVMGMGWRIADSYPKREISWTDYKREAALRYRKGEWKRSVLPFWGIEPVEFCRSC